LFPVTSHKSAVLSVQRLSHLPVATNWVAHIIGSFKDEPAFEEVLALGRAIRVADRPPEEADTQA
jgi:hypothetical protein